MTQIELFDWDAKIRQGTFTGSVGDPSLSLPNVGVGSSTRVDFFVTKSVCQRRKFHPSQTAKASLKNSFAVNPPNVLELAQTTSSLTSNQMIPFALLLGVEVTLAAFGLLGDLLARSRGVGTLVCVVHLGGFPTQRPLVLLLLTVLQPSRVIQYQLTPD